jgi:5-methylcytosine-specific restriction endonuclease McrA
MPYQSIVPVGKHPNGGMLYQVAGSNKPPCGAEKAFRAAVDLHGGNCFYCKKALAKKDGAYLWTLDHIEPLAVGGKDNLSNFVVACQPCNAKKSNKPIDAFNASATKEWLLALRKQIDDRLAKLATNK